ncbi:hornerin-like isoform X2 [Pieris rapae]|uniref:hornerin-like isoform X2 n=1 Tax=Pieris rapae TaxID=64459 RepID=UPI001E27AFA2|nr:hornerin-like isoform X2 [Pieris rapae]
MRIVRVDKTGMRVTRASLPLVALVFLFTQTHAQKYILCKSHGSEDCQLYTSDPDDNMATSPSHVCGEISSFGITRLSDQFHTIQPLGLDTELMKNIFCKSVVHVNTANYHEPFVYFRARYPRDRRQATFTPRGKYRGQTQSQYLAIDRGNGKDEGKAEAHSAADSSRASVSGNSGMGQAQSQSIYDPNCEDCYGAPRQEVESLKHQLGRTTDYGPSWSSAGPEYSSRFPGGTRHPDQSPDTSSYNPERTGLNSPNGYIGRSYRPDGKIIPDGSGGDSNGYGPSYNYGPRGSGSSYPGSNGYGPGKDIQSGVVSKDKPYRNDGNPTNRFGEQVDRTIPIGNFPKSDTNPLHPGNNYGLQQNGYPVQEGSHNGMPIHDLNDQTKYSTPDGRGDQTLRGNYIPNVSSQTGQNNNMLQHQPNKNYNQPTSINPNDGSYYNPRPNGPYSPGQSGESYVPNGASLPPGQLNAFDPKTSHNNAQPGANGQTRVPQQTPTGIANYDRNIYPPGFYVSGDNQRNWPPSSPFQTPDGKTYVCCEVQSPYGQNSGGRPNNLLTPGITQPGGNYGSEGPGERYNLQNGPRQYSPERESGFIPGGQYQYPSSKYTPPGKQFVPGNDEYGAGGQYNPSGQYSPGSIPKSSVVGPGSQDTSRSTPGTGSGGQYIPGRNGEPGTGNLGSQFTPGGSPATGSGNKYIPGRDTGSGTRSPGGQYSPGTGQTVPGQDLGLGPEGQYSPGSSPVTGSSGQYVPGRDMGSGTGGPGGPYSPGTGPSTGLGGQYIPGRDLVSGTGVPGGLYSPGTGPSTGAGGRYLPEKDMGTGNRAPGDQYSPGSGSTTGSGGQLIPGSDMGPRTGGPGGQYSPGSRPSTGSGGQYIPGRDIGSGTGGSGGQFSPGTGPSTGLGGQYIPGRDIGSGTGGPGGQYSPGAGPSIGSGGQYIPGRDMGSGTGGPGGKYSPGTGPSTGLGGQYIPGRDIGSGTGGPGGQYSPGTGPSMESGGQYIPGRDIGSGTGGPGVQYSPGTSPSTGSGGQYIPGTDLGSRIGGPGSQYSPGVSPFIGSGERYIPRGSGSETSSSGGPFNPGGGASQYDLANGVPSGREGQGTNYRPDSETGGGNGQYTPSVTGDGVSLPGGQSLPENRYGYKNSPDKVGEGPNGAYGNPGSIGSGTTGRYPNGQTGTQYEIGRTNPSYNSVPQNYVDPQSVADDDDSEAEAVVSQAINGTTASATSKGGNDKARAQTHVQGTYSGSGSFQAQAQIAGKNKEAESEVSGGKKGASSSATGSGRNNKSQASVQLGSETGAVQTNSQSSGAMHSSNSQVQGSVKGGTADAQARGPGSTSSQAQIGFTPFKDSEKSKHDLQKIPFVGGGMASAQSSGRTGQSQSQLHGTFKYGITYNGAAQAGASIDKDAIFPNRLSFEKIDVFNEKDKNINVDFTEPPPELETEKTPETTPALPELVVEEQKEDVVTTTEKNFDETLTDSESKYDAHPHADHHSFETTPSEPAITDNTRSFHNYYGTEYDTYTTDKDDNDDYDSENSDEPEVDQGAEFPSYDEYRGDATHQSLQVPRKGVDVHQSTGGNTQHIVLGSLKKHDAEITQKSSERPDEKRIYQPGERVPGTGGYTIPIGFTGSVKSVASKDNTYVIGSKDSPSQAQTVALTPGTGKVRYTYPSSYGKYVHPTNLRSLNNKRDDDRYVSMSKSVTRDLDNDNNIRKQYSHTYYTKSSSCGYFTFTCTMVSSAEGKKKVCKPKIPTNPDGTPIRC